MVINREEHYLARNIHDKTDKKRWGIFSFHQRHTDSLEKLIYDN